MRYEAPDSLEGAVALLAGAQGEARVLAGGTDLLVQMRADVLDPDLIVDIKKIKETRAVTEEKGGWRIGAAVTGAELKEHARLKKAWPGVVEAANLIGSTQVQGRATLGGNLCNGSPAADSVPALIAAGAVATLVGPKGKRDLPVEDVMLGPRKLALGKGEIVASFLLPPRAARSSDAYLRFIPRTEMDIAVVGAGVSLTVDGAGLVTVPDMPVPDPMSAVMKNPEVAEAKRLVNACESDFRKLVQGALVTGARYGELASLRASDFNPDSHTVHVRTSKSGKGRHIVLNDEGVALFKSLVAGKPSDALLLPKRDGSSWAAAHQIRPMADASKHAKINPPISFHGLRHTYASLAIMNGVPLMVVAKNLGHSDTRMVEKHYGHLAQNFITDAIRKGAPTFGIEPETDVVSIDEQRTKGTAS